MSYRDLFRGNMRILIISRLLWSLTGSIVWPYLSLFILALGGNPALIGLVNAVGSLGGLVLFPVGGYIADKRGRARFVSLGTIGLAASYAVLASAQNWWMVALGMFLQQSSLFYTPALSAITADSMPKGMRGLGYALTTSVPAAVGILSPYIGGYLINVYTVVPANRIGYIFSFILGLIVAAVRLKFLKETLENTDEQVSLRNMKLLFKSAFQELLRSFRWLFNELRAYSIVAALISFASTIAGPFWVVYATKIIGLTEYEWGILLLIGGAASTVMSLPIGGFIDRHGCRKAMLISNVINFASNIAFIYCKDFIQTTIVYTVLVIGNSFSFISSSALLANTVPRIMRGRISAILGQGIMTVTLRGGFSSGFLLFIFGAAGSLVGGLIYSMNPAYPWIIFPIVSAISAILCLKQIHDPGKIEE